MSSTGGVVPVHGALRSSLVAAYRHSVPTLLISVGWVLASLPLVTIGISSLGAYAAVRSVKENGHIDRSEVVTTLRNHWLNAFLLSGALLAMCVLFALYLGQFIATGGRMAGILAVVTLYVAYHLWVVLVVAFVLLVEGADLGDAIRSGYRWSVARPLTTVLVGLVTTMLLVVSAVLTIAVVLLFPAITFRFHTELVTRTLPAGRRARMDEGTP